MNITGWRWFLAAAMMALLGLSSCSSPDATKEALSTVPPSIESKEVLFNRGHRLYMLRSFDSAAVALRLASAKDSTYVDPVLDLGQLHYDWAMAETDEQSPVRRSRLKEALKYLGAAEAMGNTDAATYDRLCEIGIALNDDRAFLRYAKKNADRYPYDRQYYNLGLAYFEVKDYQSVIRTQKEATGKFGQSSYLGGYYRQMGRAYMKIDRDQTAERTLESGLKAVDQCLTAIRKEKAKDSAEWKRLSGDRIAILQLLRKLHQTYSETEKLKNVERLLKEAGVSL